MPRLQDRFCFLMNTCTWTTHADLPGCSQIQASGQWKQVFRWFQMEHPQLGNARNIPLHNNTRWGSAHGMLSVSFELQDMSVPIVMLLCSRETHTGPYSQLIHLLSMPMPSSARSPPCTRKKALNVTFPGRHSSSRSLTGCTSSAVLRYSRCDDACAHCLS